MRYIFNLSKCFDAGKHQKHHKPHYTPAFVDVDEEGDKEEVIPCMAFDWDFYFSTDYYFEDSVYFDEPRPLSGGDFFALESPLFPDLYERNSV